MREIKFRAWDKTKETMYHNGFEINYKGEITRTYGLYPSPNLFLMQYTGLKDKNGKEIYEGDIYRIFRLLVTSDKEDEFYVIRNFIEDVYFLKDLIDSGDTIEIIGNIYENPELLKENK